MRKKKKIVKNKNELPATSGVKKKRIIKSRVEKPYNHGTMSESAFWGMVRSTLRQKSRWWKPIQECKKAAKRDYVGDNKRLKYCYRCNHCADLFPEKLVSVHHKIPVGSLKCGADLEQFVKNLFCEIDGLEVVCEICHKLWHENDKKEKE